MGDIDWGATIGWGVIIGLLAVAAWLGVFRFARSCPKCRAIPLSVRHVTREDDRNMYRCERCGAIYVREPGKKLVPYAQWKQGDGLPAARVVSYDRTDEST